MSKYIEYKGYIGSIEYSEQDGVFHGKAEGVKSLISYEGDSATALVSDFHDAVDEYLDYCSEKNIDPEKPFKGTFNVRIGSELHRQAAQKAGELGISLNAFITQAIREMLMPA